MHVAPESHRPLVSSRVGRQVQVREEDLLRAQQRDLLGLGLLDLQHEVGLPEDRGRVGHDARALRGECGVLDRAALAGAGLDQHLVAVLAQLARTRPA